MKICKKCGTVNETNICKYCGSEIPEVVVKKEIQKVNPKTEKRIYDFYYYFYLIFSTISIIGYFCKIDIIVIISTSILILGCFLERLLNMSRNYFGLLGIVVGAVGGYLYTHDLVVGCMFGVSVVLFIVGLIQVIIGHILGWLISKC